MEYQTKVGTKLPDLFGLHLQTNKKQLSISNNGLNEVIGMQWGSYVHVGSTQNHTIMGKYQFP